jgi:addiction module RelE/StbE family toxin
VKRILLPSSSFHSAVKKLVKRNPPAFDQVKTTLELLAADAFHPHLKTHKLKGKFKGAWSCSASYDLRIVFLFVEYQESEAILLETVGTHDEVY